MRGKLSLVAALCLGVALVLVLQSHQHLAPRHTLTPSSAERFTSAAISIGIVDTDADDDPDVAGCAEASGGPVGIWIPAAIGCLVPADLATPQAPERPSLGSRAPPASSI